MSMQDTFKGKNKTYKNEVVKFHRAGIESQNVYSFIPFASITRVYLGLLPPTITPKTILGGIIAFVGLCILPMGFVGKWALVLGLIAIVGGVIIALNSLQSWYALNIDMASGAVYSFGADNKDYVDKGYRLLLSAINEREDNRKGGTYNFINGQFEKCAIGDNAQTN